jgi:hypothetical protein
VVIFYRTPDSPLLHPTQAAAGKGFIQVDVPTDKPNLMAYVNDLLIRQTLESKPELIGAEPTPEAPPAPVEPVYNPGTIARHGPGKVYDCPRCASDQRAAEIMTKVIDYFTASEAISRVATVEQLDRLANYINERKEWLNANPE